MNHRICPDCPGDQHDQNTSRKYDGYFLFSGNSHADAPRDSREIKSSQVKLTAVRTVLISAFKIRVCIGKFCSFHRRLAVCIRFHRRGEKGCELIQATQQQKHLRFHLLETGLMKCQLLEKGLVLWTLVSGHNLTCSSQEKHTTHINLALAHCHWWDKYVVTYKCFIQNLW